VGFSRIRLFPGVKIEPIGPHPLLLSGVRRTGNPNRLARFCAVRGLTPMCVAISSQLLSSVPFGSDSVENPPDDCHFRITSHVFACGKQARTSMIAISPVPDWQRRIQKCK
jgi:hypothetical protein